MTYCVAMRLHEGLVFLSDSRTNAGLDHIASFRKMMIYEQPGDRFMVLLSAGNLSISQSVRELLQVEKIDAGPAAIALTPKGKQAAPEVDGLLEKNGRWLLAERIDDERARADRVTEVLGELVE